MITYTMYINISLCEINFYFQPWPPLFYQRWHWFCIQITGACLYIILGFIVYPECLKSSAYPRAVLPHCCDIGNTPDRVASLASYSTAEKRLMKCSDGTLHSLSFYSYVESCIELLINASLIYQSQFIELLLPVECIHALQKMEGRSPLKNLFKSKTLVYTVVFAIAVAVQSDMVDSMRWFHIYPDRTMQRLRFRWL